MIAVDTNVVVRLLVDDANATEQNVAARSLFAREQVSVSQTVLLETEWVLRRGFRLGRNEIAKALKRLLAMPRLAISGREKMRAAVEALANGCDFADALHAFGAEADVEAFLTFDTDFVRRARSLSGLPDVRLLAA